jgi:uncharacterized protein with HEPN domain
MKDSTIRRLERILEFAKKVEKRTENISLDDFIQADLLQESVLYCLGQIGEIASNIPDDEQEKYPGIFWYQMIGLRNRLFHDYEEIDMTRVFAITQEPIAQLARNIEEILRK